MDSFEEIPLKRLKNGMGNMNSVPKSAPYSGTSTKRGYCSTGRTTRRDPSPRTNDSFAFFAKGADKGRIPNSYSKNVMGDFCSTPLSFVYAIDRVLNGLLTDALCVKGSLKFWSDG
jgi:hypothetical protein